MERRLLAQAAAAAQARTIAEGMLARGGLTGRAQVERVAALNARIEQLEAALCGNGQVLTAWPPTRVLSWSCDLQHWSVMQLLA